MRVRSFQLKLIFSYILVILIPFALIAFFLDKNLEENALHNIKSSLVIKARLIEDQLHSKRMVKEERGYLGVLVKGLAQKTDCRVTVIDAHGKVLADSGKTQDSIPDMENHADRPEVKTALAGDTGIDIRYSPTLKIDMLYVALPIKADDGIVGALRLALTLESVQKTLSVIRKTVFSGLSFALFFAIILGSILAARTVKPINKMIQVSRRFSEGDFSRRIFQSSKDEIGELAATLNRMAADIENKMSQIEGQGQRLSAVFNSMIEGVIVIDKAGRIVSINPAVENIFGVSGKNAKGRLFLEAIRNNDISDVINSVLDKGKTVQGEITLVYPVCKTFEVSATPIFDSSHVSGCLAVIHDITEIRKRSAKILLPMFHTS
jgi:two-component system phosphate regulon sensor histidine kinase PhoR